MTSGLDQAAPRAPRRIVQSGDAPLLAVRNLQKFFPVKKGVLRRTVAHVRAVDDVSFEIRPGETLGLVGESGCGKTTVGRSILRLIEPTGGHVRFEGEDVVAARGEKLRQMRRRMQIIFQDPYASLNPRMSVSDIIGEGLRVHKLVSSRQELEDRVRELLLKVKLDPVYVNRYPHEFSGGQRQRIGVARALSLSPKFIVCDEAVSALDVSIQAQVINLLMDLRDEMGLSYLFVAHDLSVVRHISHRVAVMYLGKIVETATTEELFADPKHPYTKALLSAVPVADPDRRPQRTVLIGDVPSPIAPPPGCPFHTRCPSVMEICRHEKPPLKECGTGHQFTCHLDV
ncbi:MAG: dipeptide ABC transporter ATP-binding protein [Candidatus Eisenbacteria bacterium]|uniref:Dipeptide ABC transporter ATP-binding protein n=1 Tax=Eiseniibacteriota bacterium TaxID=2212470 RepID=A0A956LWY5_UNCEI|nr:dipeptide ABC transporter ATP-binding protein [Candidatus Eisenbacteria bacterium]